MKNHSIKCLCALVVCALIATAIAEDYPRAGAQAGLSTKFHNVSGTATIVSSNTIRVNEFYYDGGGPAVYFYLGTNATHDAFQNGIYFTNLLSGTAYSDASVTVTLSGGQTLDGYNAISVWCRDAKVDFGSGIFPPHIESIGRSNGVASLSVSGAQGQSYELQGATNVVDWSDLDVKTNTTGTVNFTDSNALPLRVYRVEVQ